MAGYSKIYYVGGLGGFMGADGINPILFEIMVGESDRQWLQVQYHDKAIKPIGNIHIIILNKPNDENALLDACLAFYPKFFENCESLKVVGKKLRGVKRLDFDLQPELIPKEWFKLREEAKETFRRLNIFEAELHKLDLGIKNDE